MATYTLTADHSHVYLNSGVQNKVFVDSNSDYITTANSGTGTALQTIVDHGQTLATLFQFANHVDFSGFKNDLTGQATISVPKGTPLPTIKPDGSGGSWVGHEHFISDPPAVLQHHLVILRQ